MKVTQRDSYYQTSQTTKTQGSYPLIITKKMWQNDISYTGVVMESSSVFCCTVAHHPTVVTLWGGLASFLGILQINVHQYPNTECIEKFRSKLIGSVDKVLDDMSLDPQDPSNMLAVGKHAWNPRTGKQRANLWGSLVSGSKFGVHQVK